MTSSSAERLLEVSDLRVAFATEDGIVQAVDGVSFTLEGSEILAVVGESGSGKSVTAMTLMGLTRGDNSRFEGEAFFDGQDLITASDDVLRSVRGAGIAMVFQDPMSSLDPVHRVGSQIVEQIRAHDKQVSKSEAMERAIELMERVGIPRAAERARSYPHEFSGGMRQRVMIAMALSCSPKVLIADEPTTALDVTIQAQILELMRELQENLGTAIILITHDMGVVAENADRVVVMYAGRKVEEASAQTLFEAPGHPYTRGLLGSIPALDAAAHEAPGRARLNEIKGMVPSLHDLPRGCSFAPRCEFATDQCHAAYPPLAEHRPGHLIACWHADKLLADAA
jgi:oligopeptide/dipeptide ABC transporter ATP-binding protein